MSTTTSPGATTGRRTFGPVTASLLVHLAAAPFAMILGRAACPLLDDASLSILGASGVASVLTAWGLRWLLMRGRLADWAAVRTADAVDADRLARLFERWWVSVATHVATFLVGTGVGALILRVSLGHSVTNWRFWYSVMLVAGFVITLDAVLGDYLLARDLAKARTAGARYRAPNRRITLRDLVLFALATLPVGIMVALVYRRVVLEGNARGLTAMDLLVWLVEIGVSIAVWSLVTVALMRQTRARAAHQVQTLIRELDRDEIPVRAQVVTGGVWGETAATLNVAADSLEQRARLETAVRTYVGDEVAEVTRTSDVTRLSGERCDMTLLFADIRGFTARSADADPQVIVALLDAYFARAVEAIEFHGGHVDKFIGDGLMCWFAPQPGDPDDDAGASRAFRGARRLLESVVELNAELVAAGQDPVEIGVGLNTGPVVRGNLGAGRRKQWTVIGETVNLASRLEGQTKGLGIPLVLSDAVATRLSDDGRATLRDLGEHAIRGQPQPVRLWGYTT